jgi:hypothetical protein
MVLRGARPAGELKMAPYTQGVIGWGGGIALHNEMTAIPDSFEMNSCYHKHLKKIYATDRNLKIRDVFT